MEGTGIPGRFGGLPDEYYRIDQAEIVILPVPFDRTTTYQHGADKGPAALIEASRNLELYDIETQTEVYKKGIHTAAEIIADSSEEMLAKLYQQAGEWMDRKKFLAVIGGEHSLSQAPIRAAAERYPGISILQLDAHADLYPSYESNPWSHASVMARVRECGEVANVVSVGLRSLSAEELPYVQRENTFFAHQLAGGWIEKAIGRLNEKVYITFDLDAFDCSLMPSTGTPEPGGLKWEETLLFLKEVFSQRNVVSFDIVELSPNPYNKAPDYTAAKLLYKMLSYKFYYAGRNAT